MNSFWRILWTLVLAGVLGCMDAGNVGSSSGCVEGSGVPKTVVRDIDAFRAVAIDGVFEVKIAADGKTALTLTADDNLLPHIVTEVKDDTLFIRSGRSICAKSAMKISVGTDALGAVTTTGANDVSLDKLASDSLDLQIDGSGALSASGHAVEFSATIKGAADLQAKDLKAEKVRVTVAGAGDAQVYASKSLYAVISGAGDVVYYGHPAEVKREITGWGEVTPR